MFITGCHRSGTSLLASLLKGALALSDGNDDCKEEPEASLDNPRGFFESRQLLELNESLLSSIGAHWHTPPLFPITWPIQGRLEVFHNERLSFESYALNNNWVDKDPRLCITHPAYLHILLKRVPLACVLREPMEVAISLYARNAIPIERGLGLWFIYNFHLAASIRPGDVLTLYSSLLIDDLEIQSQSIIKELNGLLDRQGIQVPEMSQWRTIFRQHVEPGLNRSGLSRPPSNPQTLVDPVLLDSCEKLYNQVKDAKPDFRNQFIDTFSALPRSILEVIERQQLCSPEIRLQERLHAQEQELSVLNIECQKLRTQQVTSNNSLKKFLSRLLRYFSRLFHIGWNK